MSRYNFKETEQKWQALWAKNKCFEVKFLEKNYYHKFVDQMIFF